MASNEFDPKPDPNRRGSDRPCLIPGGDTNASIRRLA